MNRVFDFYKPPFHQEMTLHGAVLWDADNKRVEPYHAAEMLNELLAEVERLKATQRKLAEMFIRAKDHAWQLDVNSDQCDECMEIDLLYLDPAVQAAIKEAGDGKA